MIDDDGINEQPPERNQDHAQEELRDRVEDLWSECKGIKRELASDLDRLALKMCNIGARMEYYGGFDEMAKHGKELCGAADIARGWAREVRKDAVAKRLNLGLEAGR